ncbi:hypothetical protein HMPREF0495_00058 [Levilactobacillus brevis ATCC 14869 = DSM 20054]|uniref:Uncharacterized protein n=2 Tax=Levilactobacillus brevis TaxID=1580 RepID=U2R617_LEVBR|nr:hypothetical protein HMPREF0495_00058 [Levilactobacillus brevis ATCC 14869 = DSM 20054]MCT3570978.1 hypothetical protein [Levilactobacillus brevis]MCT3571888.1 hypothetical protein [Levilactobacillus brevis]
MARRPFMQTPPHSLGTILKALRHILAADATPEAVLKDIDVPVWYLLELEADHITVADGDTLTLICSCYKLTVDQLLMLSAAADLPEAIVHMTIQQYRTYEVPNDLPDQPWPDSTQVTPLITNSDPLAKHTYADVLHCVRTQVEDQSVTAVSALLNVSPMAYWQMEAGQLPVPFWLQRKIAFRLHLRNLTTLTRATDILTTICQHLDIAPEGLPTELRLP